MKGKSVQIVLVIAVSGVILVFPACLHNSLLAGMRLLSTDLSFENPDQDDTLSYEPVQSKAFVSAVFVVKSPPGTILFDQIARLWLLVCFPDQKALLLRC
jgi:hypothetical protein